MAITIKKKRLFPQFLYKIENKMKGNHIFDRKRVNYKNKFGKKFYIQ